MNKKYVKNIVMIVERIYDKGILESNELLSEISTDIEIKSVIKDVYYYYNILLEILKNYKLLIILLILLFFIILKKILIL